MPSGWENAPEYAGRPWGPLHWVVCLALLAPLTFGVFSCQRAASQQPAEAADSQTAAPNETRTIITGIAHVTDGDTLSLTRLPVRIWGIDAPEGAQTCGDITAGERATAAMHDLADGRQVVCIMRDWDGRNRRPVATCSVDGRDLGAAIVEAGWAWDFDEYSHGAYDEQESHAVAGQLGVHALSCAEKPWEYRARIRRERERSRSQ